jgi:hypothetical protein
MPITPGDAHWWEGRITRGEAVRRATLGLAAGLVFSAPGRRLPLGRAPAAGGSW